MDRRDFIRSAATLVSISSVAGSATARTGTYKAPINPFPGTEKGSRQFLFQEALKNKPWLLGYQSTQAESFESIATVQGKLPDSLRGDLYRTGPARHEVADFRYGHWFDGDGMVQRWCIDGDQVTHKARMVNTRKYQREKAAGKALYPAFGSAPDNPRAASSADDLNVGNISMLSHHNKLYALWEAGSPWEIDADTLKTVGRKVFSADTDGLPFSAHPRIEPDGTLWNFGYASTFGQLVFWKVNKSGKLVRAGTVPCDPMSMPHDFIVTARHIVVLIPPLHYDRGSDIFLDAHQWKADEATRVLVVDKHNFKKYRWYELPAQWLFHFGNGWEDDDGVIRFDGARSADPLAMFQDFRQIMYGETPRPSYARQYSYRIDTRRGRIDETPLFDSSLGSEFPRIDPRVSCRRYQRLVMLTVNTRSAPEHGHMNAVSVASIDNGAVDTFTYPDHMIPEEHLLVPAPGSGPEGEGWVIGTALDYKRGQSMLNIFNVEAIADGPVASVSLPYALPLGLHGTFV